MKKTTLPLLLVTLVFSISHSLRSQNFVVNPDFENESVLDWNAETWQQVSKETFNRVFKNSAIKRAGYEKLKQNIEVLKNSGKFEQ